MNMTAQEARDEVRRHVMRREQEQREYPRRIAALEAALRRIQALAGNPDPAEGARQIIRAAGDALEGKEGGVVNRPRTGSAAYCDRNGWRVGDILQGDEGYGPERILITAIGESYVLARRISGKERWGEGIEITWDLSHRDWKKVSP